MLRGLNFTFDSIDEEQHEKDLRMVFNRLRKGNSSINADKCKLSQSELEFLGLTITSEGLRPLKSKVEAL